MQVSHEGEVGEHGPWLVVFEKDATNGGNFSAITGIDADDSTTTVTSEIADQATVTRLPSNVADLLLEGKPNLDAIFERPANETQFFRIISPGIQGEYTLTYEDKTTATLDHNSDAEMIQSKLNEMGVVVDGVAFEFEVTGEGTQDSPFRVEIVKGVTNSRGAYSSLEADNLGLVTRPMDTADAAASVKPQDFELTPNDYQRVYYNFSAEDVEIHGGAGNDTFVSDDSMAAMYVYGDSGNDNFLIGRVVSTTRATLNGEEIDVVDGDDGATPGVSFNAYFYGGTGNDYFEVNRNVGELDLFGEAGDDTFFLKALLKKDDPNANPEELEGGEILAGAGDEQGNLEEGDDDTLINYITNNRVDIFGGSGFRYRGCRGHGCVG